MTDLTLPTARRRGLLWLTILVTAIVAAALSWWAWTTPVGAEDVSQIEIRTKSGLVGNAAEAKAMLDMDTPDLYLRVQTADGEVRLPTKDDTPIGSGLRWDLPDRLALADVREVAVWDEDTISDDIVDRVTPDFESEQPRVVEGGRFRVILRGRVAKPAGWALPALIVSGVVGLLALGKLVWDQVV